MYLHWYILTILCDGLYARFFLAQPRVLPALFSLHLFVDRVPKMWLIHRATDRSFRNFRTSTSGDWRMLSSLGTSGDRFWSYKIAKGSVGLAVVSQHFIFTFKVCRVFRQDASKHACFQNGDAIAINNDNKKIVCCRISDSRCLVLKDGSSSTNVVIMQSLTFERESNLTIRLVSYNILFSDTGPSYFIKTYLHKIFYPTEHSQF